MSRIMPIGSVSAEPVMERARSPPRMGVPLATMALLLRAPLSASVVSALLLVPIGELSVALAVAMLFSQVRPACS